MARKDTALDLIQEEENRQRNGIELIASENFTLQPSEATVHTDQ